MTPVRHEEDVEIMASILQQNGYPAGSKELQFEEAQKSKVPVLRQVTSVLRSKEWRLPCECAAQGVGMGPKKDR
jgi:hypothetical protein